MDDTDPRIEASAEATGPVKVNSLGLALLAGLAAVVGLAPAMLIFGRPHLLPLLGFVAALGSFILVKRSTAATYRPTLLEFLISGFGGVAPQAMLALLWLLLYALLRGGISLVASLLGWLSPPAPSWDAAAIAFRVTLVPALLVVLFLGSVARDMMFDELYPRVPGVRSPLYGVATHRRRWLVIGTLIIVGLFAAGLWLLWGVSRRTGFQLDLLFAQVYLLLVSAWVAGVVSSSAPPSRPSGAEGAVEKLFNASGYEVQRAPRTGQSETDPLLLNLDFVARNQEHAFAVEIRSQEDPAQAIGWEIAASLRAASSALARFLTPTTVEPLLVLVGGTLSESLQQFVEEEPVRIGRIPDASAVAEILATDDPGSLRGLAHTYLGLPEDAGGTPASGSDTPASGGRA